MRDIFSHKLILILTLLLIALLVSTLAILLYLQFIKQQTNLNQAYTIKEVVEDKKYAGHKIAESDAPQRSAEPPFYYLSPSTQNKLTVLDYYGTSTVCCDMRYTIVYTDMDARVFWIMNGGGYAPGPDAGWYGPFNLK